MRFIAFDLETTGFVSGVDQIIEVGAVRFIDGQVDAIFSTLVDPLKPIPLAASKVNGITDDMVKGQPRIETLLTSFSEFCGDDVMVAHNAPFDTQFLIADYLKHEFATPSGLVLDTLPISKKVFRGLANHKLGTIVSHLKIPTTDFHRAEEDATYCGKVFIEMIKRISINGQPPAIDNLVALTGRPHFKFPLVERKPKQLDLLSLF